MTIHTNNSVDHNSSWPPLYQTRYSKRAKRPFLQITQEHGLEVILPYRKKTFNIVLLLEEKKRWIIRTLKKMLHQPLLRSKTLPLPPTELECQGISTTWKIGYQSIDHAKHVKLILNSTAFQNPYLVLKGNTGNTALCFKTLKKFLIQQASLTLIPWLQQLSNLTRLSFNRAIIRGQSTLWGSCNSRKTISLNYKLLFLPPHLTRHVLIHELCHTQYLNHSTRFWALFNQWDPECMQHRKALKQADHYLPDWLKTNNSFN